MGTILASACEKGELSLNLGVSTSVHDSGLIEFLKAEFETAHPAYRLRALAAGSGELLELVARGDVDVIISHSPAAELELMERGGGVLRREVMWNDFVIVGPPSDPAGVRGMADATAALLRIGAADAPFASRADDSGTHRKELELWGDAPPSARGEGYREMGSGMAATLRAASELGGYALTDRGTFLSQRESIELEITLEDDPRLLNLYSVIVGAEAREPIGARAFADWVTSDDGKRLIASFGVERYGEQLFHPFD